MNATVNSTTGVEGGNSFSFDNDRLDSCFSFHITLICVCNTYNNDILETD